MSGSPRRGGLRGARRLFNPSSQLFERYVDDRPGHDWWRRKRTEGTAIAIAVPRQLRPGELIDVTAALPASALLDEMRFLLATGIRPAMGEPFAGAAEIVQRARGRSHYAEDSPHEGMTIP